MVSHKQDAYLDRDEALIYALDDVVLSRESFSVALLIGVNRFNEASQRFIRSRSHHFRKPEEEACSLHMVYQQRLR
jgi:hypothetical protein